MNMTEKVKQLLVTVLLQNVNAMSRDINHAIQAKLLSRWGMSSNAIIKQRNNLSQELIEQFGNIQMVMENGVAEEKPMDIAGALAGIVGKAPQVDPKKVVVQAGPPGWKQDINGEWFEVK